MTDHFNQLNSATHVHPLVRRLRYPARSPETTPDRLLRWITVDRFPLHVAYRDRAAKLDRHARGVTTDACDFADPHPLLVVMDIQVGMTVSPTRVWVVPRHERLQIASAVLGGIDMRLLAETAMEIVLFRGGEDLRRRLRFCRAGHGEVSMSARAEVEQRQKDEGTDHGNALQVGNWLN